MPGKIDTTPRKRASQRRSRLTVDALLEATARILIKEGHDRASTNRIAEIAGTSIGSLYQYFPNKEALIAALIDRHNEKVMAAVQGEMAAAAHLPLAQAVRTLVSAAIKAHRIDPRLHRVLTEQIPRVGKLEKVARFNKEYYARFEDYLRKHHCEIHVADLELAAFVCVTAIEALTHTAVLDRRLLSEQSTKALIGEATHLVVRYLSGRQQSA